MQIGLLVIGAAAVAGVLVYNRVQERAARREAERAFGSGHDDVLLGEARFEPAAEPAPVRSKPPIAARALPDALVDYIIELAPAKPVSGVALLEGWTPVERRFKSYLLTAAGEPV